MSDSSGSLKESVRNGSAARNQASKASDEFESLKASRQTPDQTAATGQNLTHYHSFFYDLLSWEHPRMSAIAYFSIVTTIIVARYFPILPLIFKTTAWVLGSVALAEGVGKSVLSQSLLAHVRPKRYWTIPRESLEATLDDVEQFINFFVIEFQRILFAENVAVTFATFIAAMLGYFMIKFTPLWGLSFLSVSALFLGPLIYRTNQELIDESLESVSQLASAQASQVRNLAGQHTAKAQEQLRSFTGQYTAKASEMLGNNKNRQKVKGSDMPNVPKGSPQRKTSGKQRTAQAAS